MEVNDTKVKVLDNEWHHIHYKGKMYKTGEVLTIEPKDFDPKVFMKVGKPVVPKIEETSTVTSAITSDTTASTVTVPPTEPDEKPRIRRKKLS